MKIGVHRYIKAFVFFLVLILCSLNTKAQTIILTSDQQLTDLTNSDKKINMSNRIKNNN